MYMYVYMHVAGLSKPLFGSPISLHVATGSSLCLPVVAKREVRWSAMI